MNLLLAGFGAAIGAGLRYFVTNYGKKHWEKFGKNYNNLPFPTLLINLTGSLILGFIFAKGASPFVYALFGTGVMGGYTTFSTLNTELLGMIHEQNWRGLFWYGMSSYIGGFICLMAGYFLGKI